MYTVILKIYVTSLKSILKRQNVFYYKKIIMASHLNESLILIIQS